MAPQVNWWMNKTIHLINWVRIQEKNLKDWTPSWWQNKDVIAKVSRNKSFWEKQERTPTVRQNSFNPGRRKLVGKLDSTGHSAKQQATAMPGFPTFIGQSQSGHRSNQNESFFGENNRTGLNRMSFSEKKSSVSFSSTFSVQKLEVEENIFFNWTESFGKKISKNNPRPKNLTASVRSSFPDSE